MKDIVPNKRKIHVEANTAMLADYSCKGKLSEEKEDPGIPTILCSNKNNYFRYALCDLGVGVSVMPFSIYKKLDRDKLVPNECHFKWLTNLLLFLLVFVIILLSSFLMCKYL
jgi:hypothetical protein